MNRHYYCFIIKNKKIPLRLEPERDRESEYAHPEGSTSHFRSTRYYTTLWESAQTWRVIS